MKPYFILLLGLFGMQTNAQNIHFKISKPACIFTFLEAATGSPDVSPALTSYIYSHVPPADTSRFSVLVQDFSSIRTSYNYIFDEYPRERQNTQSAKDFLTMAVVESADIDGFMNRIVGLLPNEQWLRLRKIMNDATLIYDKMIGQPCAKDLKKQSANLQAYEGRASRIFKRLHHFYGSTWDTTMPFAIAIYPIPGNGGGTTATPHNNDIILGALTERNDCPSFVSIALHEICHVLYADQPLQLQFELDHSFATNMSSNAGFAYHYLNEALATACGNGWAYEQLSGHQDTGNWYADEYINGFAKAIYPLVKGYIEQGKVLDTHFADSCITIFSRQFPNAYKSYTNLLNRINLYTDATDNQQYQLINNKLRSNFNISSCAGGYPINDRSMLAVIDQGQDTRLFVVHTHHDSNYHFLGQKYPLLKKMDPHQEGIVSFFDGNDKAVIVINVNDISGLDKACSLLAQAGEIKAGHLFTPLN